LQPSLLNASGQRAKVLRQEEECGLEGVEDHRVPFRGHQVGRKEDQTGEAFRCPSTADKCSLSGTPLQSPYWVRFSDPILYLSCFNWSYAEISTSHV